MVQYKRNNKQAEDKNRTMKIIQLNESNAIVEMLMQDIQLYKVNKDHILYKLKDTDIYICIVNTTYVYKVKYNTQVVKNLYQSNNLNRENIVQLCNLNVFM